MKGKNTVCIVGRPNVGKSTLFNKFSGMRRAIVDDMPGVTRDRIFTHADIGGAERILIDTGGFEPVSEDEILFQVRQQAELAIEESDVICFVVDGRDGVTPVDEEIAKTLRKSGKPVIVAVNKIDDPKNESLAADFHSLGFEKVVAVSAEHSMGLGDLEDELAEFLEKPEPYVEDETEDEAPDDKKMECTIAVVGKPNAGKSSLINKLLGENRLLVSGTPGTTRDAVDTTLKWHGNYFTFVDTAGIRKKSRVSQKLEKFSIIMALKSVARTELSLLLIDAEKGITDQDARIAGLIHDEGRACIILVNKWDIVEKDTQSTIRFEKELREKLKFISFAPVLFISAKTGQRVGKIFETMDRVMKEFTKRVPTGPLNRKLKIWTDRKPPPLHKRLRPKVYYISQTRAAPPTFHCVVSYPKGISQAYRRYIVNKLRQEYGFEGSPVRCVFQERKGRHTLKPKRPEKRSIKKRAIRK